MVVCSSPVAITYLSDMPPVSSKEFLDIQAITECRCTLNKKIYFSVSLFAWRILWAIFLHHFPTVQYFQNFKELQDVNSHQTNWGHHDYVLKYSPKGKTKQVFLLSDTEFISDFKNLLRDNFQNTIKYQSNYQW